MKNQNLTYTTPMKNLLIITILTGLFAISCTDKPEVEQKKEELKGYQEDLKSLNNKISALEDKISEMDSTFGKKEIKKTLITAFDVNPTYFEHKVEMRGSVESRRNVTIGSEIPGKIQRIHVKEGQQVKKGQTLMTLDASVIRNNIAELKTSMELAETVYERQENLWKKKIGTEMQFLQSKNNYESLQRKLATANSQLDQSIIKAPFNGSIDEVIAKEGEIAQPGMPMVRIVNPDDVYIKSDISERFIGVFKKGDEVEIYFPSQDKRLMSKITSVGQVINSQNRTFEAEIAVPDGLNSVTPNQVVVLKLRDYTNEAAFQVPTMVIQKDSKGSFVYRIKKKGDNMIATKSHIETGVSYENNTEILKGIQAGQKVAHLGVRDLSEGVLVKISSKSGTAKTISKR
jgi:membrane fusion protein (multidrug efflux system)